MIFCWMNYSPLIKYIFRKCALFSIINLVIHPFSTFKHLNNQFSFVTISPITLNWLSSGDTCDHWLLLLYIYFCTFQLAGPLTCGVNWLCSYAFLLDVVKSWNTWYSYIVHLETETISLYYAGRQSFSADIPSSILQIVSLPTAFCKRFIRVVRSW
jgi:hypothetical protein